MDIEFNPNCNFWTFSFLSFFRNIPQWVKPIHTNKSSNYNHTAMLKHIFPYNICKDKQIWKDTVLPEYIKISTIIFCLIQE